MRGQLASTLRNAALALGAALAFGGAAHADEASCAAMAAKTLAPAEIALPSAGAKVTKAEWVAAQGASVAYCKLLGEITSIDKAAHPVLFQVNLPADWNGKAVQYGGGGLNGTLITGLATLRDQPPVVPTPINQGYVTFGTDAGHPNAKPDIQIFWNNAEESENHGYAAYKKTLDVARALLTAYYGRKPARMYFFGGSEGGREAMGSLQRFPQDYDGVVATVPAIHWIGGKLANNYYWSKVQAGGWMNTAELQLLQKATNDACDDMDGLKDGIISRYEGCLAKFKIDTLRCAGGADTGDNCLSDAQIALVNAFRSPYRYGFPIAYGFTEFGPLSVGGEAMDGTVNNWVVDDDKKPADDLGQSHYGPGTVRFLITRDPQHRGDIDLNAYKDRILAASKLMDNTNPDLSPFLARGGKLIMKENTADYTVSPYGVFAYYDQVVKTMGRAKVDSFIRFYVNPGVNHQGSGVAGDGSPIPDRVDLLGALDRWVESGSAPGELTVTSYDKTAPLATRPLCFYPQYPHYKGAGDPKLASSFTCRNVR